MCPINTYAPRDGQHLCAQVLNTILQFAIRSGFSLRYNSSIRGCTYLIASSCNRRTRASCISKQQSKSDQSFEKISGCEVCAMALYATEAALEMILAEDFNSGDETDIKEDPSFPLPRLSDQESDSSSESDDDLPLPPPRRSDQLNSDGANPSDPESQPFRSRSSSPLFISPCCKAKLLDHLQSQRLASVYLSSLAKPGSSDLASHLCLALSVHHTC